MARLTIRGNASVRYYTSITNLDALSVGSDGAGTDYNGVAEGEALVSMEGWESSASTINVPDVLSLETGNIPGETTFGTASLTYYTDDTTNAIWDAELEGDAGLMVICPAPATPGGAIAQDDVYTVFSVEVISRSRALTTGNEAEMHTISYAIKSRTEGTAVA